MDGIRFVSYVYVDIFLQVRNGFKIQETCFTYVTFAFQILFKVM